MTSDIKEWLPEFKVSAENDSELMEYFVKTPVVGEILYTNKWLVLGRKGAGKSALFEYLRATPSLELNNFTVQTLSFREYPWPIHRLYKDSMEGEMVAYYKSWKYIIVLTVLNSIIKKEEEYGTITGELKKAKAYIQKIYSNPSPTLMEIIKAKLPLIRKIGLPSAGANGVDLSGGALEFEDIRDDQKLQSQLRSNAFQLLQHFEDLVKRNISKKILIAIDQLDENWLESEITEYSKILINLISAANIINNEPQFQGKLKIVIFLRTDIYETLKFNDKNKIFQDNAVVISWDKESLDNMFFERVRIRKPDDFSMDLTKKSNGAFENNHLRGKVKPFDYILARTFFRPRDIIVFFNQIRKHHEKSKTGLYSKEDVYEAAHNYSQSLYNELNDEWTVQRPEIIDYLNILIHIGVNIFNYSEYSKKAMETIPGASKALIDEALRFLFINSIIGQKKNVLWEFYCQKPTLIIDFTREFKVNAGLMKQLDLTEKRKTTERKRNVK